MLSKCRVSTLLFILSATVKDKLPIKDPTKVDQAKMLLHAETLSALSQSSHAWSRDG